MKRILDTCRSDPSETLLPNADLKSSLIIIIIIMIIIMRLWHTHRSSILGQKTRSYNNQQKKKRTGKIVDLAVPVDRRIKLKECVKYKYLDLAWELKKLWNMKVAIISIVIGSFGTVTKGLLKGLEDLVVGGRVETI